MIYSLEQAEGGIMTSNERRGFAQSRIWYSWRVQVASLSYPSKRRSRTMIYDHSESTGVCVRFTGQRVRWNEPKLSTYRRGSTWPINIKSTR